MCESLLKLLFFIFIFKTMGTVIASEVLPKEIFLKELNERLEQVLKNSTEAQYFLEEDLRDAQKVLSEASLTWVDSLSTLPLLFEGDKRPMITLSAHHSFMARPQDQIELVLALIFNLKRQLEGSTLPIPKLRIQLFAKKFSPILLGTNSSCSLSLYPIPFPLTSSQREKFTMNLLSLMKSKGYEFRSRGAAKILWLDSRTYTEDGCWGSYRNVQEITARIVDINTKRNKELGKEDSESCKHDPLNNDRALKKILKSINNNLPNCTSAFWIN